MAQHSTGGLPDRRLLAVGAVAGMAVGAAVGTTLRKARQRSAPQVDEAASVADGSADSRLIDWELAGSIAARMNQGERLGTDERERLDRYYRSLVDQCFPIVRAYTGIPLEGTSERTFAFDRVDWVNANLEGFRHLLAPVEEMVASQQRRGGTMAAVNRRAASAEVGVLLGYLCRRVLGQYDLALMGKEPVDGGKLYYVEPNIRQIEASLGMPRNDFRMWLALHETTHAFEFEGNDWVVGYFNGLLGEYLGTVKGDVALLSSGIGGMRTIFNRTREREAGASWLEAVMTPEQRAIFGRLQALMCIVEGYSNHVMNAVGRDLLPTYETISRRFEERKVRRSPADELFSRLTGLRLKLEQYRLGEEFIDAIVAKRGHAAARRVWDGPDYLPTMDEIHAPDRWLTRIDAMDAATPLPA
jgi:coenzyme F420 biosynthesis associated uncharacterized protein